MPSLVTVLSSPSNYTTAFSVRADIPSRIGDGGGGGGGSSTTHQPVIPNLIADAFELPAALNPPDVGNLLATGSNAVYYEEKSFEFFEDAAEFFNSPLPFDASENGLFNGRFVPPPPRPPFLVDEPVLADGLTTCDLCSWAMPTKSTFIFEGTIEKASELGWPLTLIIVSLLSAILGAIIMVTVVRCKRKKTSNNRNETHVQWWSRNKRPNNNNHLRRSNIYTAHPADSIRGLHGHQQQQLQQQLQQQQLHPTSQQVTTLQPQESHLYQQQQQQHNARNHNHYPHPHQQQQQQHHHHHHHHQQQQQHHHLEQQQQSLPQPSTLPLHLQLHQQQQLPHHLQHHTMGMVPIETCNWPNISTLVVPS